MRTLSICLALVIASSAATAEAASRSQKPRKKPTAVNNYQTVNVPAARGPARAYPAVLVRGGRRCGPKAATVGESYMRGMADLVRAQAEYNLITSQARLYAAAAYRQELDNHLAKIDTYFNAKSKNRAYRKVGY
jgi:hypothetical protein